MGVLELIQQKSFLGKEFVTWLWFRSEQNPRIEIKGPRQCEIEFMQQLALESNYGDARSSVLRGDSPSTSPEAATALLEGKKIKRARMKVICDGNDWIGTMDGETLNVSGLQMPKVGKLPFEEALQLRIEFAVDFDSIVSELFNTFLELRLDEKEWSRELKKIQKWVGEK